MRGLRMVLPVVLLGAWSAVSPQPALADTRDKGQLKCELPRARGSIAIPPALQHGRYLHAMCEFLLQLDTEVRVNGVELQAEQKRLDSLDRQRQGEKRLSQVGTEGVPVPSLDRLDNTIGLAGHDAEIRHLEQLSKILEQSLRAPRFNEQEFWSQWDQENERYRKVAESITAVQEHLTVEMMKQTEEKLSRINTMIKENDEGWKDKSK